MISVGWGIIGCRIRRCRIRMGFMRPSEGVGPGSFNLGRGRCVREIIHVLRFLAAGKTRVSSLFPMASPCISALMCK